MKYARALPTHANGIADLAEVCHQELLAPLGLRFDHDYVRSFFAENIAGNDDFVAIVALDDSDNVIGCASGSHAESWVSPDQTIFIADSWFLHQRHRGGLAGSGLISRLKKAVEKRSELMTVTIMAGSPEASIPILRRLGFREFEQNFVARLG
jgi:L-amino acid N-acyltransferase YncA